MDRARILIIGAGVSGLAFADWLRDDDYLIVEAEREIGGYCRTVAREGFTWDYSGHFFHFRHPDIERDLVRRMDGTRVIRVQRDSRIWYAERFVDFPFQKHIHQLPRADYEECVRDLENRSEASGGSFEDMLYSRYGRGIAERFLVPYNEKVYATSLTNLDADAMGRFFPHASAEEILSTDRTSRADGYNATFTYPEGGAVEYAKALARGVDEERIELDERVLRIDLKRKVATTGRRRIAYEHLVSSVPLISLLRMCGLDYDPEVFRYNDVLVFNLGFDQKGLRDVHWIYYPQRELAFYRVGFYDNIFDSPRMSLYVEIGLPSDATLGADDRRTLKSQVLADLRSCRVLGHQNLIASHDVVLNPAYVHISKRSEAEALDRRSWLAALGVHSIGRYGAWTYCSIEDNIVEARALADRLQRRG